MVSHHVFLKGEKDGPRFVLLDIIPSGSKAGQCIGPGVSVAYGADDIDIVGSQVNSVHGIG